MDYNGYQMSRIMNIEHLRALYDNPVDTAVRKNIGYLDGHAKRFIAHSPF